MERSEEARALLAMLECPGWAEVLEPRLREKLDALQYKALAGRADMTEGALRACLGEAAVLQWVLSWPRTQVEEFQLALEDEIRVRQSEDLESKREEHYLRYGHHGPVLDDETPPGDDD